MPTTSTPCKTINGAIGKADSGDTIYVAGGTYTSTEQHVVYINKELSLVGGWDSTFLTQNNISIIDGENVRRGIYSTSEATIDQFEIRYGFGSGTVQYSRGGGIYNYQSTLTIKNSFIHNNSATVGGGVYSDHGGTLTIINSTIGENSATSGATAGAGVGVGRTDNVKLYNVTIANNDSANGSGGGIGFGGEPFNTYVLEIQNSVIANNSAPTSPDCYTDDVTVISNGYNLIEDTTGCNFSAATGDIVGQDPILGSLSTSGIYHPLIGSPIIDAGNPAAPGSGGNACEATDQLGRTRPIDGNSDTNAICDIGAYESDPPSQSEIDTIEIYSGSPQFGIVSSVFNDSLQAIVKDQYSVPFAGAEVTFTAPASGAGGTFSNSTNQTTITTDSNGIATASTFTANATEGSYIVEATVSGVASPAQFELENYTPTPTTLSVESGSPQRRSLIVIFRYGLQPCSSISMVNQCKV